MEKHRSPLACFHQAFLALLLATTTPTSCSEGKTSSPAICLPAQGIIRPPNTLSHQVWLRANRPTHHTAGEKSTTSPRGRARAPSPSQPEQPPARDNYPRLRPAAVTKRFHCTPARTAICTYGLSPSSDDPVRVCLLLLLPTEKPRLQLMLLLTCSCESLLFGPTVESSYLSLASQPARRTHPPRLPR